MHQQSTCTVGDNIYTQLHLMETAVCLQRTMYFNLNERANNLSQHISSGILLNMELRGPLNKRTAEACSGVEGPVHLCL